MARAGPVLRRAPCPVDPAEPIGLANDFNALGVFTEAPTLIG